jgi:hypothetical protein
LPVAKPKYLLTEPFAVSALWASFLPMLIAVHPSSVCAHRAAG